MADTIPSAAWLERTRRSIVRVGHRAEQIRMSDAQLLFRTLSLIESDELPEPAIVADDQGIAAVWTHGDRNLLVRVLNQKVTIRRSWGGVPAIRAANAKVQGDHAETLRRHVRIVFGNTINRNAKPTIIADIEQGGLQ